jgi:hypothetical protein
MGQHTDRIFGAKPGWTRKLHEHTPSSEIGKAGHPRKAGQPAVDRVL